MSQKKSTYKSDLFMWHDKKIDPTCWFFQTDCPEMRRKLMNRKGFIDTSIRSTPPLWVMKKQYLHAQSAFRAFRRLTHRNCILNKSTGVYYAKREQHSA